MEKPELCDELSLESVRKCLIRQEDTIVFCLIERAKFPANSSAYKPSSGSSIPGFSGSLVEYIVRKTEILQATVSFGLMIVVWFLGPLLDSIIVLFVYFLKAEYTIKCQYKCVYTICIYNISSIMRH